MTNKTTPAPARWLHLVSGVVLLGSFFLPWVAWQGIKVSGYDLPAGNFFKIAETNFKLGNPFPQFAFTLYAFWLIPVLIILTLALVWQKKESSLAAFISGTMVLALLTVFYLFTSTLIDLGVGTSAIKMMQPASFVAAVAAVFFILTALPYHNWLKKAAWIILGPVLAFGAYKMGEKFVMAETFTKSDDVKADFTVNANELLKEFAANDTAANVKYREKMLVVNGTATQVEQKLDSTTIVQFADSTGSYIAFSFEKEQYEQVKKLKAGDMVSLKGSCSGSIYSEILGTTSITFKRSTINKQ